MQEAVKLVIVIQLVGSDYFQFFPLTLFLINLQYSLL